MNGFENLYGKPQISEACRIPLSEDDLDVLKRCTVADISMMPEYLKAIVILANKITNLNAAISLISHRDPFAALTGITASMESAVEQLTSDCLDLFEFANANYVLEVLDEDFEKSKDNEENKPD